MKEQNTEAVWKALADPTRRQLLDLLKERPRTTGELTAQFPALSRFAVMKHLGLLEEAGLVLVRKEGRQVWHHLNAVPIQLIYERWVRSFSAVWSSSLVSLKQFTEGREPRLDSMQIEQEVLIQARPATVYRGLTAEIGEWWTHSFSGAPKRIVLEPWVGGRFFEEFPDGEGGALYATVTYLEPNKQLRLAGPMGMAGPVHGVSTFELEDQGAATLLKLSHRAIGPVTEEAKANYAKGWTSLLGKHLKAFAETGSRP